MDREVAAHLVNISSTLTRLETRMNDGFRSIETKQDGVEKALNDHTLADERRFGSIEGTLKNRTWQAGLAYVLALAAQILGFKLPSGGGQ